MPSAPNWHPYAERKQQSKRIRPFRSKQHLSAENNSGSSVAAYERDSSHNWSTFRLRLSTRWTCCIQSFTGKKQKNQARASSQTSDEKHKSDCTCNAPNHHPPSTPDATNPNIRPCHRPISFRPHTCPWSSPENYSSFSTCALVSQSLPTCRFSLSLSVFQTHICYIHHLLVCRPIWLFCLMKAINSQLHSVGFFHLHVTDICFGRSFRPDDRNPRWFSRTSFHAPLDIIRLLLYATYPPNLTNYCSFPSRRSIAHRLRQSRPRTLWVLQFESCAYSLAKSF